MAEGEKTEAPTPQRLREARKRGDVATSPELTGALVALAGLFALQQQGSHIVNGLLALLTRDLATAADVGKLTPASVGAQLRGDVLSGLILLVPLAATMVVVALIIAAANTRGLIALKPPTLSLSRLNPLEGMKHLVGKESAILLLKALAKMAVVALCVTLTAPTWQGLLPVMPFMTLGPTVTTMWQDSMQLAIQITEAFFVIGAVDFGYRRFSWYRRLRMTKQEVKEEAKRSEGNPHVRARMRQIARKRLRKLLEGGGLRRVPQADVVITNPTHFAVAVQYRVGKMRAPRVIAKGQRLAALRIKEAARLHNIPIVENKPLAQALFKGVEINQEVPAELYQAIAQVLAFVYRMRSGYGPSGRRVGGPRRSGART